MPMTSKEMARLLKANGFIEIKKWWISPQISKSINKKDCNCPISQQRLRKRFGTSYIETSWA